jgi:hypothetical protein
MLSQAAPNVLKVFDISIRQRCNKAPLCTRRRLRNVSTRHIGRIGKGIAAAFIAEKINKHVRAPRFNRERECIRPIVVPSKKINPSTVAIRSRPIPPARWIGSTRSETGAPAGQVSAAAPARAMAGVAARLQGRVGVAQAHCAFNFRRRRARRRVLVRPDRRAYP